MPIVRHGDMAILTTAFNHTDNQFFLDNWNTFTGGLEALYDIMFVSEVLPPGQRAIALSKNHAALYNDDKLWHKESAINYLIRQLPPKYEYVAILDNDIVMEDVRWYERARQVIRHCVMMQPFDIVRYMGISSVEAINNSACYYNAGRSLMGHGNPGMAVIYEREYLDHMGGLFDECIIGGGDWLNAVPFFINTHDVQLPIIKATLCKDSVERYLAYLDRARRFISRSRYQAFDYLPGSTILHLFHGHLKHRQYNTRYNMINNYQLSQIAARGDNGLYQLIGPTTVVDHINQYFYSRTQISPGPNQDSEYSTLWMKSLNLYS